MKQPTESITNNAVRIWKLILFGCGPLALQYMVSSCRRVHEITATDTKAQAGSMLHMAASRHKFYWALQLLLEGMLVSLYMLRTDTRRLPLTPRHLSLTTDSLTQFQERRWTRWTRGPT